MAEGVELAVAYVDIYANTDKITKNVESTFKDVAKQGDKAGKDLGDNMSKSFDRGWRGAVNEFKRGFGDGVRSTGRDVDQLNRQVGKVSNEVIRLAGGLADVDQTWVRMAQSGSRSLGGINVAATAAVAGVAAIGTAAFVVGKQLYDLGSTWDDVGDKITGRTGKMGKELQGITDSIKAVAKDTASSIGDIGDIAGQVVQSLHLTDKPLQDMTKTIADLNDLTGEKLGIRELGRAFRLFGVEAKDQVGALDSLYNASANVGIPLNELVRIVGKAGPALKQFGLDFGESAALVASFEDAGLDAESAVNGLRVALKIFADAGKEPQQALRDTITEIKNLSDAGNAAGATDLAAKTFGKGFAPFLDAIKSGAVDVNSLNRALSDTGPTISDVRGATEDWKEELTRLTNQLQVGLGPVAEVVFGGINRELQGIIDGFRNVNRAIQTAKDLWNSAFGETGELQPGTPGVPGLSSLGGAVTGGSRAPGSGVPGQNPLDVFGGGGGGSVNVGPSFRSGAGGGRSLPSTGGGGGGSGGGGVERWRGTFSSVLDRLGLPQEPWLSRGLMQMKSESGGNPRAINNWDSNAAKGTPSKGLMQTIDPTFNAYLPPGFAKDVYNPESNIAASIMYTLSRYGGPQGWQGHGYRSGGRIGGSGRGDTVPIMAEPGEHMLTRDDVKAMGGQSGVYGFRAGLKSGGGVLDWMKLGSSGGDWGNKGGAKGDIGQRIGDNIRPRDQQWGDMRPGVIPGETWRPRGPSSDLGTFFPWWGFGKIGQLGPGRPRSKWGDSGIGKAPPGSRERENRRDIWGGKPWDPGNTPPAHVWPGLPAPGRKSQWWDKPPQQTLGRRLRGYQAGGEVIDDPMAMLQILQAAGVDPSKIGPGVDPATLIHGAGKGAAPGAGVAGAAEALKAPGQTTGTTARTEGFIPAAAGSTGVAGTSFAASLLNIGNQIVAGLIDKGVELATQAVSAAATAGSFGMGGQAAGPAASILFGTIGDMAKVGTKFGFQAASIGIDALIEQLTPFGAPRWLGYDYTGFAPQIALQGVATTSLEEAIAAQGQGREPAPEPPGTQHLGSGLPAAPGPGSFPVTPKPAPGAPGSRPIIGQGVAAGPGTPPFGEAPPPSNIPQGRAPGSGPAPAAPAGPGGPRGPSAPGGPKPMGPGGPTPMGPAPARKPPIPNIGGGKAGKNDLLKGFFGFDQGGMLMPGAAGINRTKRPEPVFTNTQWQSVQQAIQLQKPSGGSGGTGINIQNLYAQDMDEAVRKLTDQQKLAMMRHAGRP